MRGKRRISVRLNDESLDFLRRLSAATGRDLSRCVREAISALRGVDVLQVLPQAHVPRMLPEDVLALAPPYLGWARGDLRTEAMRLFKLALAASWACKELFPKTPGVVERYKGMLDLYYLTEGK